MIDGLAVNAYAEPVVSLDVHLVVPSEDIGRVVSASEGQGLKIERFEHSINLTSDASDLRIQLRTDARYQTFIPRSKEKDVLGYRMLVSDVADVLRGKI